MQKKVAIFCCISPYFSTEQERLFVNHKFFVPFHKKTDKIFEYDNLAKKKKEFFLLFSLKIKIRRFELCRI